MLTKYFDLSNNFDIKLNIIKMWIELQVDLRGSLTKWGNVETKTYLGEQGCYILTHNLGRRIEAFRGIGLNTLNYDDCFYKSFRAGLERHIRTIYPSAEIKSFLLHDLEERIWKEAVRLQESIKGSVIVSTACDVHIPHRGHVLEINRLYNLQGNKIGFGPRPGNPSIDKQIQFLSSIVGSNSVILAEEGTDSGSTIIHILESFKSRCVSVSAIILSFSSKEGIDKVRAVFDGPIIVLDGVYQFIIDWIPDHDFVPFTPNCGRVIGTDVGTEKYPVYTPDGFPLAFPYIRPFGNLREWGSIPSNYENEFSLYCMQQALNLFTQLEDMNGGTHLKIRDLMGTYPKVCIPICLGGTPFPSLDTRMVNYLNSISHTLSLVERK